MGDSVQRKTVAARLFLAISCCAMATAAPASETVTYSYDALGRLVATSSSGGTNNGLTTSIGYDPAGNRQNYTVAGAPAGGGTGGGGTGGGGGGGGATPVVADGSFELPSQNGGYAYNPSAPGATFTGFSGITANATAWGFAAAPDGVQVGFLQGGSTTQGATITLAVSGLTPGASYRIVFSHARRPIDDAMWFSVLFDGTNVAGIASTSSSFTQATSAAFTANGTTGTISFVAVVTDRAIAGAIDNVSVVPA
jgi:hypothetical protein